MTDPELWGRIAADPLTTPDGTPLGALLLRESNFRSQAQAEVAVLEYRRWLYLSGLRPDLGLFRNMQQLQAWHRNGSPRIVRADRAPVSGADEILELYRREFLSEPPLAFWRSKGREKLTLRVLAVGAACWGTAFVYGMTLAPRTATPMVLLLGLGFVACIAFLVFVSSANCGERTRNPA